MAELVAAAHRAGAAGRSRPGSCIRPTAVDDAGFTIEHGRRRRLRGHAAARPERWVRQTNFDNDEAVGYLADRLARLGVEEALAKAGAEPGGLVRIGEREFDWQPDRLRGADFVPGQPGHRRPARGAQQAPAAVERGHAGCPPAALRGSGTFIRG